MIRPVKELKGYEKIFLKIGEQKTINFTISDKELSFMDGEGNEKVEAGHFHVFVGTNSENVQKLDLDLK